MLNFEYPKYTCMVWRYGEKVPYRQNLALICLTGSEKTGFTDGRRTDDGGLRDDSSSAVQ